MAAWAERMGGKLLKGHEVTLKMEWSLFLVAEKSHAGAFLSNSLGAIPHGCLLYVNF